MLLDREPPRLSPPQPKRVAVESCVPESTPHRASPLSGKGSGDCPNADDDPSLVIQDMDLFPSLTLELGHTENSPPNGFEVRRQMPFPRKSRPIPADQAEFIIRHSVSTFIRLTVAERPSRPKVPRAPII